MRIAPNSAHAAFPKTNNHVRMLLADRELDSAKRRVSGTSAANDIKKLKMYNATLNLARYFTSISLSASLGTCPHSGHSVDSFNPVRSYLQKRQWGFDRLELIGKWHPSRNLMTNAKFSIRQMLRRMSSKPTPDATHELEARATATNLSHILSKLPGITRTFPTTVMKFTSPPQRGTRCTCRCCGTPAPAARP